MTNKRIYEMVVLATFLTIILVLNFSGIGFINLFQAVGGTVGGTIIHIPVIVACIYFGKKIGIGTGLIFGLTSWIYALNRAVLPLEFVFRNPIVAILPRVLFALITVILYNSLKKLIKRDSLNIILTAVLSSIIHALLVLPLLVIFGLDTIANIYEVDKASLDVIFNLIKAILVYNTIFEAIIAGIIVPPIIYALRSANIKRFE